MKNESKSQNSPAKQPCLLSVIIVAALLLAAALSFGCSSFERTKNATTGVVSPSKAETVVTALQAANAVSTPVNPYSPLIAVFGQVAGAFLAGYGGAHVRIKRQDPVDATPTVVAVKQN